MFSWTVPLKPQQNIQHHVDHLFAKVIPSSLPKSAASSSLRLASSLKVFASSVALLCQSFSSDICLDKVESSSLCCLAGFREHQETISRSSFNISYILNCATFLKYDGLWLCCCALSVFVPKNIQEASKRYIWIWIYIYIYTNIHLFILIDSRDSSLQ